VRRPTPVAKSAVSPRAPLTVSGLDPVFTTQRRTDTHSVPAGPAGHGAVIKGAYRYLLWRTLSASASGTILFVMLNPSRADAAIDDPTLRRCMAFGRSWGFGRLEVCNLFALRTHDPRRLEIARDPIGLLNDQHLASAVQRATTVVAAWGARGLYRHRAGAVDAVFADRAIWCLGTTKGKEPRHPLYVRGDTPLTRWR